MKTPRAALYLRLSQDREGTELGIDRQREACAELADRLGLDVVATFIDNDTGASTRSRKARPQYAEMLAELDAGRFDTIVSYSMSRLTRRPREAEGLLERAEAGRLTLRTVASGDPDLTRADGRAMFRTLVAFDVAEAERISERVTAAAEQRARAGGHGGGQRRFAYSPDATELVPEEADALRWAYGHVAAGGSIGSVVKAWEARGIVGPQGATIRGVQVRDTLLRPMNAGLSSYRGTVVGTSKLPAVIDVPTFEAVREILLDPARRSTVGRPPKTLLAPVLRCAICGGRVSGSSRQTKGSRALVLTYACRARHVSRTRTPVDELISDLVVAYLEANADALTRPAPGTRSTSRTDAEELRERLARLARLAASGELDPADFAAAAKPLRASLSAAESRVVAESSRVASVSLVSAPDVREAWDALSVDDRRAVVVELIDTIEVSRGRSGRFTPEGIVVRWRE